MRTRDKYTYGTLFGDYSYRNGERMARVRDRLLEVPVEIYVTFYTNDGGVWLIHHYEDGFEFAHEAFERGIEWVDNDPDDVELAEWMNELARKAEGSAA